MIADKLPLGLLKESMDSAEKFNSLSALLGVVLALCGVAVLLSLAIHKGDPWKTASFSIYGAGLLSVYSSSTLYHTLQGRAKKVFQKLDHLSIYLLIAGTYTPFTLITLRGSWGWTLFVIVWGLAVIGMALDILSGDRHKILPVILYLAMGWLAIIALGPLVRALPAWGLAWLVAGGLFYTGGVVFYALDEKLTYGHGIWHLFVLAGSASHFIAILLYVA